MKRRQFLQGCGVAATITLAGCGGADSPDDGGSSPNDDPTDTSTHGQSTSDVVTTRGTQPRVVGQSIATEETSCGSPDGSASVSFAPDDGSIAIEGVIAANTPCHTATLASIDYDDTSDTLTVQIGVESTGQTCQECLGRVDYRASIGFIGGLPGRVVVEHGGTNPGTVADASR